MSKLLSIVDWLVGFSDALAGILKCPPAYALLMVGLVVGAVIIGIAGRIAFKLQVWNKAINAPKQPQMAFTTQSPGQVVRAGRAARREKGCFIFIVGLMLLAYLLSRMQLLDDTLKFIWQVFTTILQILVP